MQNALILAAIGGLVWWNRYIIFGMPVLTAEQRAANLARQGGHIAPPPVSPLAPKPAPAPVQRPTRAATPAHMFSTNKEAADHIRSIIPLPPDVRITTWKAGGNWRATVKSASAGLDKKLTIHPDGKITEG